MTPTLGGTQAVAQQSFQTGAAQSASSGNAAAQGQPASGKKERRNSLQEMADNMNEQMSGKGAGAISCILGRNARVGIWPFARDNIPVSSRNADRIIADFLSFLVPRRPKCLDYLDLGQMKSMAAGIAASGLLAKNRGNILAALTNAGDVLPKANFQHDIDVVFIGEFHTVSNRLFLSFRAVERETGKLLAQTRTYRLAEEYTRAGAEDIAMNFEAGIKQAAARLADQANRMTELVSAGVYYQDGGSQPEFGRSVLERLTIEIVKNHSSVLTGRKLKTRGKPDSASMAARSIAFELAPAGKTKVSSSNVSVRKKPLAGGALSARQATAAADTNKPDPIDNGVYALKGRYWVFGEVIDLKLTLKNKSGETHAWQGRLRTDSVRNLQLFPRNKKLPRARPTGSFTFELLTDRGRDPVYRKGQDLKLLTRLGRPAWLYCFYSDATKKTVQILPFNTRARLNRGYKVKKGVLHKWPDYARDRFRLTIGNDTEGVEVVRCIATDRNVTRELPPELRGMIIPETEEEKQNFTVSPIPESIVLRLSSIFSKLRNVRIAAASATITVIGKQAASR